MKNTNNDLRRLAAILTIAILAFAWGLVALSFLLGADAGLQGVMLAAAILATPVALILCGLAFGKVRADNGLDDDDDYGFENQYGPSVNVDGSPMVGGVDIHGNTYGTTSSHPNTWD